MPGVTLSYSSPGVTPLVFGFIRYTDWFSETQISDTETVTSSGQQWVVANPGNIPATRIIVRIRSNTSAGFTNPVLVNETTGDGIPLLRDAASADDEIYFKTYHIEDDDSPRVEYSTNDGGSYSDDFGNYDVANVPAGQRLLSFSLAPGNNTLRLDSGGTVNCDVVITADAPFA